MIWAFKVRCCEPCRAKHVLPDYKLRKLGIDVALLAHLPHLECHAYHRCVACCMHMQTHMHGGQCNIDCPRRRGSGYSAFKVRQYWRRHVDRELRRAGAGVTVADLQGLPNVRKVERKHVAAVAAQLAETKRASVQQRFVVVIIVT